VRSVLDEVLIVLPAAWAVEVVVPINNKRDS
jgi:hypothetical protein